MRGICARAWRLRVRWQPVNLLAAQGGVKYGTTRIFQPPSIS